MGMEDVKIEIPADHKVLCIRPARNQDAFKEVVKDIQDLGLTEYDLVTYLGQNGVRWMEEWRTIWIESREWYRSGNDSIRLVSYDGRSISREVIGGTDILHLETGGMTNREIIEFYSELIKRTDPHCSPLIVNQSCVLHPRLIPHIRTYLSEYRKTVQSFYNDHDIVIEISTYQVPAH